MDRIVSHVVPQTSGPTTSASRFGMMEGSLIHRVEPIYPPIARAAGIQGSVDHRAVIGNGRRSREVAGSERHQC